MDQLIGQYIHCGRLKSGYDIRYMLLTIRMGLDIAVHSRLKTAEAEIKAGFIQIRPWKFYPLGITGF